MKYLSIVVVALFLGYVKIGFSLEKEGILDGQESHGGGAFVCRNASGEIQSAHLLDLFEASKVYGFTISNSKEDVDVQIEKALSKVQSASNDEVTRSFGVTISEHLEKIIRHVKTKAVSVPEGVVIAPPKDTQHSLEMENCKLEGAMAWVDLTNTLYRNDKIINAMSKTDLAALYFHEALYKLFRTRGVVLNSVRVRKITGSIFSSENISALSEGLPKSGVQLCRYNHEQGIEHDMSFYKYKIGNKLHFQFNVLGGQPVISKMVAEVGPTDQNEFWFGKYLPASFYDEGMPISVNSQINLRVWRTNFPGEVHFMYGGNVVCREISEQ